MRPLLRCFDDINAKITNLLKFNENKTEVTAFSGGFGTPPVDLGFLAQYVRPTIANLKVKVD